MFHPSILSQQTKTPANDRCIKQSHTKQETMERGHLATSNSCENLAIPQRSKVNWILARVTVVSVDQIGLITDRSLRSISRSWFYRRQSLRSTRL